MSGAQTALQTASENKYAGHVSSRSTAEPECKNASEIHLGISLLLHIILTQFGEFW